MVLLLLLLQPVYCQTDMYHSKPWVPENVSPSVASFVSTRPTFGSQTSSRKPTEASAHNSYSKFAISGKPLVQHSNGLEDQESLETHSFVYLAPPPNPKNGSLDANLSPVLRVQNHADRQPYSRDGDRRIDQVSMETQYVEKGGAPKLFRKPTKPPTKSRDYLSRNTLGNGGRAKKPRLSESGQRSTRTKTSETRAVPNIRRAPTNAVNRRRTKSRTRKENSVVDQSVVPPRPTKTGTRGRRVGSTRRKATADEVEDPVTLVNFGDWAAQWDELEEAWYYYNYFTGESTWNRPDELKHIPFKNPFSNTGAEEQIEEPVPDGDVTGYSPPVTDDFQLPGVTSNGTKSQGREGNLSNHQLKENLEKHLLKVDTNDIKVNSALKLQPNGKSKRGKAKYPSARDFAKKQPKVRKTEKGNGKDYGWLDFLGLPKMKLPDFLGFNSEKQKAAEASKAAQQGKQGVRGKRRILKKHRLTPGLRGCYTRIHELLNLC